MDAEVVKEGRDAWQFLGPEPVCLSTHVLLQPVVAGLHVLEPVGAIRQAEEVGVDEISCGRKAERKNLCWGLAGSCILQDWQKTIVYHDLGDLVHFRRRLQIRLGVDIRYHALLDRVRFVLCHGEQAWYSDCFSERL